MEKESIQQANNSNGSFSKYRREQEPERRSLDPPPNSSERKRRHYLPESFNIGERMRSRGSFERYDKFKYNVGSINMSNHSIRDSAGKGNKTEFSPFQPRTDDINRSQLGKENSLKHANFKEEVVHRPKREDTTIFSPYEEKMKQYRYDNVRNREIAAVLPFHVNQERRLADNLGNLRQRLSKELSFKQVRHVDHLPIPQPPPLQLPARTFHASPREVSRDILIEQLTQSNQYLNEQIIQYKQIVHRLETELRSKDSKMLLCNENIERRVMEERLSNEKIVGEMRNQIKLLLQKNELLIKRLDQQQLEGRLRERRSQTFQEPHTQYRKGQFGFIEEDSQLVDELTQLINREYFQKVAKDKLPGKIKSSTKELKPLISQILKRNVKLESFANCVIDMRSKIAGSQENDLKKCWKWLKTLVEEAYRVKKVYQNEIRLRLHLREGTSSEQICQALLKKI